jgi:cardiolipin hydrolase
MAHDTLVHFLLETMRDGRLSRTERQEIAARTTSAAPSGSQRKAMAQALAEAVRDRMSDPADRAAVDGLWDVLSLLWPAERPAAEAVSSGEAYFGPEEPLVETLQGLLRSARSQIDVAVFTITDNRLTDELLAAHHRQVTVRVMTDDDKQWDLGSDVRQLADHGIPVVLDRSPHHFHHKFAVVDRSVLVTGSYNWTRGAALDNRENFLVTRDLGLVKSFSQAFERMWAELS